MTQTFFRIFVAGALLFGTGLVSCSSAPDKNTSSAFDTKFNKLEIGLEKSKVLEILGTPILREAQGEAETWHYAADSEGRLVQFDKGKVNSFGRDIHGAPETSGHVDTLNPKTSLGIIGESCKENKDCKDKNCHFKVCA